jgi:hypothetical protein
MSANKGIQLFLYHVHITLEPEKLQLRPQLGEV